jgi:hypothetical protein
MAVRRVGLPIAPVSAWPAGPASKPVLSRPVSSVQVKKKRKSLRERNFLAFASRICSARPAGSYARPSDRVLAFFLSTNCGVCGCRDQPRRRLGGRIWPERLQRDDGLGPNHRLQAALIPISAGNHGLPHRRPRLPRHLRFVCHPYLVSDPDLPTRVVRSGLAFSSSCLIWTGPAFNSGYVVRSGCLFPWLRPPMPACALLGLSS